MPYASAQWAEIIPNEPGRVMPPREILTTTPASHPFLVINVLIMQKFISTAVFFLICAIGATAQDVTNIQGRVIDAQTREGLPYANVSFGGISMGPGVSADAQGYFELEMASEGTANFEVTYVGYRSQYVSVTLDGPSKSVTVAMERSTEEIAEVVVEALRADDDAPVAYTNVTKKDIQEVNLGQDLPMLLDQTASVVTSSDAGAGIGYTNMRIRGTDQTRINVTVNGIPINDSESQGVFWVNMPDLSSSTSSIQIQRGVGTSTNGAAAFGATVNLNTDVFNADPYANLTIGGGSFNTLKRNLDFGTGLIGDRFMVEGRLSHLTSDGYIDRASSNLRSYYFNAGYYGDKTTLKFITFAGRERTYQSWWGTPQSRLEDDSTGMYNHAINNGLDSAQTYNLFNSGRTYNFYEYEDQVDNYGQDHYQLHWTRRISETFKAKAALHCTRGDGYFEEFRSGDAYSDYGLENPIVGEDTLTSTDLVRRRWLDNDFYGITFSMERNGRDLDVIVGGGWNRYEGLHYGEIIWMENAFDTPKDFRYYEGDAVKTDGNLFVKATYDWRSFRFYGDLQVRSISYETAGTDNDLVNYDLDANFNFFNPKFGFTYFLSNRQQVYASFAMAGREPVRSDFIDALDGEVPTAETLMDYEVGYRFQGQNLAFEANGYFMDYTDQLVVTGELNDVGSNVRTNVAESYRAGIELNISYAISSAVTLGGNWALSQNKIANFSETIYDYTNGYDVIVNEYEDTDIALSPNSVGAVYVEYSPAERALIRLQGKYVGQQFLDNTSNENRIIESFFVADLVAGYTFEPKGIEGIDVQLKVNNLFNTLYSTFGYTYSYVFGDMVTENFYYPQATINFLGQVTIRL